MNKLKSVNQGWLLLQLRLIHPIEIFFFFSFQSNLETPPPPYSKIQDRKFAPLPFSDAQMLSHTKQVCKMLSNLCSSAILHLNSLKLIVLMIFLLLTVIQHPLFYRTKYRNVSIWPCHLNTKFTDFSSIQTLRPLGMKISILANWKIVFPFPEITFVRLKNYNDWRDLKHLINLCFWHLFLLLAQTEELFNFWHSLYQKCLLLKFNTPF